LEANQDPLNLALAQEQGSGGAKGAEALPLVRSKLRKKKKVLIFS